MLILPLKKPLSSVERSEFRRLFSLDQVRAYICIGRWIRKSILKRGSAMRPDFVYFVSSTHLKLIIIELVIVRRYCARPGRIIESMGKWKCFADPLSVPTSSPTSMPSEPLQPRRRLDSARR